MRIFRNSRGFPRILPVVWDVAEVKVEEEEEEVVTRFPGI